MNLKQEIGRSIKELREGLKISQEKFAEKLNIDVSFLSGVENGRRNITLQTLEKIINSTNKNILDKIIQPLPKEILEREKIIIEISKSLPKMDIDVLRAMHLLLKPHLGKK